MPYIDESTVALERFLDWVGEKRAASGTKDAAELPSVNITFCVTLIYYFSLCDFILKYLPLGIAFPLRYLPEAALYLYAMALLAKKWRVTSFPLFWPLFICAVSMTISTIINSASLLAMLIDYRLFFRFTAFAYIGWRTAVTPQRVVQFIRGFLGLTVIELVVGALELVGGQSVQTFFAPIANMFSGAGTILSNVNTGETGWIAGTLSTYNEYGFFMVMSCLLALGLLFLKRSRRYLWLAIISAFAVVFSFSRHSLLLLVAGVGLLLLQRRTGGMVHLARSIVLITIFLTVVLGVGIGLNPAFQQRLATIASPEVMADDSAQNIRLYMSVTLTPLFLKSYPLLGQGPIAPADQVQPGERNYSMGPQLKAAPNVPGILTFFLGDVVWVMILGLYGCAGLAAVGSIFWTIAKAAKWLKREQSDPETIVLAQLCLAAIVVFILSGFFSEEMVARDAIPVFWTMAGMVLSLRTNSQSGPRPNPEIVPAC